MAIDDQDRDFGDFSGGFGVSRDFGATRDSGVGRADGSQGFSGNDGQSFSYGDRAFADRDLGLSFGDRAFADRDLGLSFGDRAFADRDLGLSFGGAQPSAGRDLGLSFGGAQPSAGPTGLRAAAPAAPAPAPARAQRRADGAADDHAAPDSLGRKLREGRISDISVSPASMLGGLAGMVVGGPIGAALGARGGQALGDSLGLDQDVTLGDLFGDFDIGFSGDDARPTSQPAVDTRSGRNDGYVSISDRVQAAPGLAGPVAPAAPAPAPAPAPDPAISDGVNPTLIYGPYFDYATGRFQGTGPYADLVRGYGVIS